MKAAITVWEDRVAPVFDVSGEILIIELASGRILSRERAALVGQEGTEKILKISQLGVEVLICGAISRFLQDLVVAHSIYVIPFVSGNAEEVLEAWIAGRLDRDEFLMPGYCKRHRHSAHCWHHLERKEADMPGQGKTRGDKGCPGLSKESSPGRGKGGGMNTSGMCACPACGEKTSHKKGNPCFEQKCPQCGATMARG